MIPITKNDGCQYAKDAFHNYVIKGIDRINQIYLSQKASFVCNVRELTMKGYLYLDFIKYFPGDKSVVNPSHCGTKCAAHYVLTLDPGEEFTIKVRLYFELEAPKTDPFGPDFDEIFQDRHKEADMFYEEVSKLYFNHPNFVKCF